VSSNKIDAKTLAKMFLAAANALEAKKEWINELNVFPVPDGDTGTNMTLTIMSAAKEVNAIEDMKMDVLCKAISSGSLRGARGNSGVILSQLLRGFTKAIREEEEIDITTMANAMQKAVETAYKAVMKPKEGTILTVARGAADKAAQLVNVTEDLNEFISQVIEYAEYVLEQTPDMLPVLKQAGVVDSGGQGLVECLKGAYDCFLGKELVFTAPVQAAKSEVKSSYEAQADIDIKYGYCTEFIILIDKVFNAINEQDFKTFLESIGDSIVCVADDDVVKVHVHTNDPGLAIQKALTYGALSNMKIDNMRLEHQEKLFKMSEKEAKAVEEVKNEKTEAVEKVEASAPIEEVKAVEKSEPEKEYGFVSVLVGNGLEKIFKDLGVDVVISGGQTMNPSTSDITDAIDKINAKVVYILPNNSNIILAANQAKSLIEDKEIIVIPTKSVPQGITALINFMPDCSPEENLEAMTEAVSLVKTGTVTYAVRDTVIDDLEIHQGNIMGIGDKSILAVGTVVEDTALSMIEKMVDENSELISIYYGDEVDEEAAADFAKEVEEKFQDVDVEFHFGGQPIYYYIISVE